MRRSHIIRKNKHGEDSQITGGKKPALSENHSSTEEWYGCGSLQFKSGIVVGPNSFNRSQKREFGLPRGARSSHWTQLQTHNTIKSIFQDILNPAQQPERPGGLLGHAELPTTSRMGILQSPADQSPTEKASIFNFSPGSNRLFRNLFQIQTQFRQSQPTPNYSFALVGWGLGFEKKQHRNFCCLTIQRRLVQSPRGWSTVDAHGRVGTTGCATTSTTAAVSSVGASAPPWLRGPFV